MNVRPLQGPHITCRQQARGPVYTSLLLYNIFMLFMYKMKEMKVMKIVTSVTQVMENIVRFEKEARSSPELQARLSYARAWYAMLIDDHGGSRRRNSLAT